VRQKLITILLGSLFLVESLYGLESSSDNACQVAYRALRHASSIRGLVIKEPVPCLVQSKDEIERYLLSALEKHVPPERMEQEEFIYKQIGLIPQEFQYREGIIELYLSQIAGYYDPEKKHFVMAAWIPGHMQEMIAIHELTHALQDQYFDLEQFLDPSKLSTDSMLARAALVEGDATAVMIDYMRKLSGQPFLEEQKDIDNIILQNLLTAALSADASRFPESLQNIIFFPYISGLRFAHALLRQGGYQRINEAFKTPPSSTAEILHPSRYIEGKRDLPQLENREPEPHDDWQVAYTDTVGEFFISSLLAGHTDNKELAARIASKWKDDSLTLFLGEDSKKLVWRILWQDVKGANDFLAAYQKVIGKIYPKETVRTLSNTSEDSKGPVSLTRRNKETLFSVEVVHKEISQRNFLALSDQPVLESRAD
jgi:hypothetical protein